MTKEKNIFDEEEIMFLDKVVDINLSLNDVADERASILAGIGGVLSVLAIGQLLTSTGLRTLGVITIIVTGLITILLSVGVIRPKALRIRRKNLMYYGGISFYSFPEYLEKVKEVVADKEKLLEQYAKEAHDLSTELRVRFKLIRCIGDILVAGLACGFILILASILL